MSDVQMWLAIALCVIILFIIIFLIIARHKRNRDKANNEFPELLEALGGITNISNIVLNGSRISLNFESKKNINKDVIKENGVGFNGSIGIICFKQSK